MFKRMVVATLAGLLVCAGGWALSQQAAPPSEARSAAPAQKSKKANRKKATAGPKTAQASAGRYTVAPAGKSAVLLDTATGQTWVLQRPGDARAVWLPARRLDSEQETQKWLEEQRTRGQDKARALEEELQAARQAADVARQQAEIQRAQAQRALEAARRQLEELEQKKAKEAPK